MNDRNLQASMERTTLDDQTSRAASKTWSILCSSCRKMLRADFESWDSDSFGARGIHHTTASACKEAAEAGCSICHTVWQRATQYGDLDVLALDMPGWFSKFYIHRYSGLMGHQGRYSEDSMVLNIWMGSTSKARGLDIRHRMEADSVLFALEPASLHPTLFDYEVASESTSSKHTWELLEGWMAHCREICKCLRAPDPSATSAMARILDVGAAGDHQIHLRSRAQLDNDISYVTLSHCWGGAMACRLYDPNLEWRALGKDITLEAAANGIEVDDLPKTFRDAVDVTRRLGVTYLWIDSLCIIQNSQADWKKESFVMGLLYANAYLTLAADGAKNSYEGLFHDRKPATISPLVIHCRQYKERLGDDMFVLLPADFWKETVSDSNLGRRAWCLQERVLSNAVIHFGRKQIAWECKGGDYCETFPKGLPAGLLDENTGFLSLIADNGRSLGTTNRAAKTRPPIYEGRHLVVHSVSPEDWRPSRRDVNKTPGTESLDKYYIWSKLVEKYSRTNITFDSDRLVAIYGVALVIGVFSLNDLYIGGTWHSILPSQLVWTIDAGVRHETLASKFPPTATPSQPPGRRASIRNAPSWTWAAVKAPILMPTPLRAGALIKADHFGLKDYLDDGFHETTFLAVKGNLHPGQVTWSTDLGVFLVIMNPDGFGNTVIHDDDGASRSADKGHAMVELAKDVPQAVRKKRSRFCCSSGVKSARSRTDTASSSDAKEDPLCGIAQLDSCDDIDMGDSDRFPVMCLPVIDTRSHRKHALHPDVIDTLNGVSGLLLVPADITFESETRFRAFYRRLGVFSLIGETPVQLRVRTSPKDKMERFFREDVKDGSERYIILT